MSLSAAALFLYSDKHINNTGTVKGMTALFPDSCVLFNENQFSVNVYHIREQQI